MRFSQDGYEPIVFVNCPISTQDKVAYYAISECVVVNAVRDGMNLVSYKETISRQCSPELDEVLKFGLTCSTFASMLANFCVINLTPAVRGYVKKDTVSMKKIDKAAEDGYVGWLPEVHCKYRLDVL